MSRDDSKVLFSSAWDIDQLIDGYPKDVNITIPAGTYPNFYFGVLETLPDNLVLPDGYVHVAEGNFKSITDNDSAWHQLGEQGWIPSTGGAKISGANIFCGLAVINNQVQIIASNWSSGLGGANRSVTLKIRYYVYADRMDY